MACMAEYAIRIEDLVKYYCGERVVDEISLSIRRGELFGIIGPDGAGKTPLFLILATLIKPDGGRVFIGNSDVIRDYRKLRTEIGYMPERFSLYPDLTVRENIDFFASIFNTTLDENYSLIKDIYARLEPFSDRKAGKLSGGMKQKLALCCALIHSPSVLLLDEPTTGVDPSSRREFWEMLAKLRKESGITMVVSTAYMDEATRCDRIAMMYRGKLMKIGSVDEIISTFDQPLMSVRSDTMFDLLSDLRELSDAEECYTFGSDHHLRLRAGTSITPSRLEEMLEGQGLYGLKIDYCHPTIEDCFMYEASKIR